MAGLKVAVTGPTGDIGISTLKALDASEAIGSVVGMARRPFDPAEHGLSPKISYVRGDVLDRDAVDAAVKGADVVIHLAFIIFGDPEKAQPINVEGSRNVFEAAVAAGVKRLVYTSSVAAYGFHEDNPQPLTEDVAPRGTEGFYYSAHKAELEELLHEIVASANGKAPETYVFRPCIVAGPDAITFVETMVAMLPLYGQLPLVRRIFGEVPFLAPVLPDPGVEFQLVHQDDVAAALVAAVEGKGEPGSYNLAAPDTLNVGHVAHALGWWTVPLPGGLIGPVDELAHRVPGLPHEFAWLTAFRVPVVMDCDRARQKLGWEPRYDSADTLAAMVRGAREQDVV